MPPVAESVRSTSGPTSRSSRADSTGAQLVYLDSAATSQKPQVVIDALAEHLRNHNANVHRGVYALAQEADAAYDGARERVAAFTGAEPDDDDLHEERHRGDQPRRLRVGPRERRRRATRC